MDDEGNLEIWKCKAEGLVKAEDISDELYDKDLEDLWLYGMGYIGRPPDGTFCANSVTLTKRVE